MKHDQKLWFWNSMYLNVAKDTLSSMGENGMDNDDE